MAAPSGISFKLRAAFMLPALLIILSLALIDAFVTDISHLTGWLIPVIFFVAVIALLLTERRRRRRNSN